MYIVPVDFTLFGGDILHYFDPLENVDTKIQDIENFAPAELNIPVI